MATTSGLDERGGDGVNGSAHTRYGPTGFRDSRTFRAAAARTSLQGSHPPIQQDGQEDGSSLTHCSTMLASKRLNPMWPHTWSTRGRMSSETEELKMAPICFRR